MVNKDFIEKLSQELGLEPNRTSGLVACIVSAMSEELQNGTSVNIADFGTFEVKKKKERISVIPSTGQRVLVPPKLVVAFKASPVLKERLNVEME